MAKTITGKRVTWELEFYWRGKRRTPSVGFIFASDNYEGVSDAIAATPEFKAFHAASEALCKKLVEAGELD